MKPSPRACLLVGALSVVASPAPAQIGVLQFGGGGGYGTGEPFGAGGSLVAGVAAGRIAYTGLRWTYHTGSTKLHGPASPPTEVRTRSQVFVMDLGVQIPVGKLEVVPGLGVGFVRFAQRVSAPAAGGGSTVTAKHEIEFLAAPGVSVSVPAGPMALIPELRYTFAGSPSNLPWRVPHRGLVASLRLMITFEVGRIRQ